MAHVRILCPKCNAPFKVDEAHKGKNGRCSKCGEPFVISWAEANQGLPLSPEPKLAESQAQQEATNLSPLAILANEAISKIQSIGSTQTEVAGDLMLKIIALGEEGISAAIEVFKSKDSKDKQIHLIIILGVWAKKHEQAKDFLIEVADGSVVATDVARSMAQIFLKKEKEKDKPCFIATAVCGIDSEEVRILRQFRDTVLLKSFLGGAFVNIYYGISPTIAALIKSSPRAQYVIRKVLVSPIARFAKRKINELF
jgi:predicted Zn finger-like uncharacterized protein